jgi:hypothetical protein
MLKTQLLFGIHMHQPVDNFQWVIKHAVEVCYAPFFEVMSRYPQFKFAVHCSGWLMEQIQMGYPKLYTQIQTLAEQGSIEFFSAGYYEPILSVVPPKDRVNQIKLLNQSIKKQFKQQAQGLWLTERVWESALIPDLKRAGIEYTVMDDYHFQCAGFDEYLLDGYYMSEEGGESIALFPISKKLRYALPFLNVKSAIEAIKSYNREPNSAAIIFDDAEKFGMWPGTYEWVHEKGWLEAFVQGVLEDTQIETSHFSTYKQANPPRGIAYLPNVSYYEMGEWSLYADDALKLENFKEEMGLERYEREGVKFLKGGIWKNFFVKYNESNRLHKRMLEMARERTRIKKKAFETSLYKLQTNDALWHGVFGGLYLPNLRDNAYRYLIECENIRYGTTTGVFVDQNELDGHEKVKMVLSEYLMRFDSTHGGQLVEFDVREHGYNWQNTLTRRKEAYHKKMFEPAKPPVMVEDGIDTIHNATFEITDELRDNVIYDWYLKNSFIDHFSNDAFSYDSFRYCNFREYGDFANQAFEVAYDETSVQFTRDGGLYFPEKTEAKLTKTYTMATKGFDFNLNFQSTFKKSLSYVLEHNFHFLDYTTLSINGELINNKEGIRQIKTLEIVDTTLKKKITIRTDIPFDLLYFPLQTLSQSEKGFDLTIQGVSMAMVFPFVGSFSIQGSLEMTDV